MPGNLSSPYCAKSAYKNDMNMKNLLLLLLFCLAVSLQAQNIREYERALNWSAQADWVETAGGERLEVWTFEGCSRSDQAPTLPLFNERFPLDGRSTLTVEMLNPIYAPLPKNTAVDAETITPDIVLQNTVEQERDRFFARVKFFPIRKNGAGYEKLVSFTLRISALPTTAPAVDRGGPNTYNSVLQTGSVYKFGVAQNGMYKLDYNFLKTELGISNLDNIDPRSIRLYGNGGTMLPERTDDARPDDLMENAIQVVGEADGKFNSGDYILFYAVGPKPVSYRPGANDPELTIRQHLYDDYAWYFIKIGDGAGLRVQTQESVDASYLTEQFDDVQRIEEDKINLLDFATSAQGSGKRWYGDYFLQTRQRSYEMNFPNVAPGAPGRVRAEFAGRSAGSSTVRLTVDGTLFTRNINAVSVSNNEASFASGALLNGSFTPDGDQVNFLLDYPQTAQASEGWLDFIEVNVRRRLIMNNTGLIFRDLQSVGRTAARYRISGANANLDIWDVTQANAPRKQAYTGTGTVEFGAPAEVLRTFVAFYSSANFPKPEKVQGAIPNQNLHGLDNLHMAVIYHPEFEAAVQELADHRRNFSGLDVATVTVDQLYNEFSSGAKDPTAIRDFARMLYERSPGKFDYLLLFGDGTFDPKNNTQSADNKDFVPVFETQESFHPIYAFPSDDYFGLLSNGEGGALDGALDIAVGRVTPRTAQEADAIVKKIIDYDKSPATLGDWRLRLLYIGDDEDSNAHINQAEKLTVAAENTERWFNLEKVYLDAFQQVATTAGDRFPDAKTAINSTIFKGALIAQYIGHGGPRGWAQERVIDNNDIAEWENPHRYPLIITATCSFGGYDDYKTLTGGEQALIKANSGAVGLFTTVRAVYIDGNNKLTDAVQGVIFQRVNGQYRAIGDILKDAKNTLSGGTEDNARRFTLLGDPAMFLALPELRVATTKINGRPAGSGAPDTLKALMPVELEGVITDLQGNLINDYNGKVTVTLFDKKQQLLTLGQDPGSPVRSFGLQRNVLFKGSATVRDGAFKINFVVPRDINYAFGNGKISYYAENGTPMDAAGADESIIIGGNANAIQDDQPPLVQVFLNTDAFVSGGITDDSPKILVKCSDDNGMNVTGVSLGHDLTAVLDGNQLEAIILNDFYESEQDNFRRGQAVYPLRNLTPGKHILYAKGWDIANNSGEGYTEFFVTEDAKAALAHVLNYPNPFTTNTWFQFEHNLAGQILDVQISIFSVSGKLVKTILHTAPAEGYRVTDINWDGRDEYGDILARGVYLYRVKVRGADAAGTAVTAESGFEKLVLLK
jgi:hypothetical protein